MNFEYIMQHFLISSSTVVIITNSLKTIGERLLNFVDWLELYKNTMGCRLTGLSVKCSAARLVGPESESREVRSWMRTAEESHSRTKRQSSASRFSLVV